MKQTFLLFILIAIACTSKKDWKLELLSNVELNEKSTLTGVFIADGRNDGVNRLYVTTRFDGVLEFDKDGESYVYVNLPGTEGKAMPFLFAQYKDSIKNFLISHSFFFSYQDNRWLSKNIKPPMIGSLYAMSGKARNDNKTRIYVGGYNGLTEYTWSDTGWIYKIIDSTIEIGGFDIGDVKGDGVKRIYCPVRHANEVIREYTFTGENFVCNKLEISKKDYRTIVIGDVRNDCKNRIYVSTDYEIKKHIYEINFENNKWVMTDITPNGPDKARYAMKIGKARNDDKNYLYVSEAKGFPMTEYEWNGSSFVANKIDAYSGATTPFCIGKVFNETKNSIYQVNLNRKQLFKLTYKK